MDVAVREWLDALASSAPAPGGGAAGALEAAIGAALVEMAASLTIGKPAYAEHEAALVAARGRASALRAGALALAVEDERAFRAVMDAYRLPREAERDRRARAARIEEALVAASEVPRRTAVNAAETVELAARIAPCTNVNVVSDLAAGVASARAALVIAIVNVEANRSGIQDPAIRDTLARAIESAEAALARADEVLAAVRSPGAAG